jgi:hypothetical protein
MATSSAASTIASKLLSTTKTLVPHIYIPPLQLLQPSFPNGRYRAAKISGRRAADFKKKAILAGVEWPYPERELKRNSLPIRIKGHKHERLQAERKLRIEAAMKEMPKKLAEFQRARASRNEPETDLSRLLGKKLMQKLKQQQLDKSTAEAKAKAKEAKTAAKVKAAELSAQIKAGAKILPTSGAPTATETAEVSNTAEENKSS